MLNKGGYVLVGLLILNPAIILAYQSIHGPVKIDTSEYAIHNRMPAPISRSIASVPVAKVEVAKEVTSKCDSKNSTDCKIEK